MMPSGQTSPSAASRVPTDPRPPIRTPPVDTSDGVLVEAYAVDVLVHGPERLRGALARLQIAKDTEARVERDLKLKRSDKLRELNAQLKLTGERTNEAERDARVDAMLREDADARELSARLDEARTLISLATIEATFEDKRLSSTRDLARLLRRD